MAYINVAEWSPDQVTDWLKGLDNSMYKYINAFTNNEIGGQELLNIRPYELEELGMYAIGHQETVLEAVEHLRNFNYNLDKENLQFLALHVATASKCLHKQLAYYFDKSKIETQILNDITRAIATIKPLVGWLDRSPFQGQLQFNELRRNILRLGIEMATSAQRDRFVENPVHQIRLTAEKLSKLADYIIQDISDPIILQPSTLNLVTLKKRESELGFNIVPNYHGIHVITDIKYNSPAHVSGKIEDGDEIIQINYQTVVGWHYKRVMQQLQESPPDVLLTLKKRPKHTKIYGQIYMKPYRLPSKKKTLPYRLGENLPSPRINLFATQNFPMILPLSCVPEKHNLSDSDSSSSGLLTPTEPRKINEKELRLYLPKPRAVLQRRNTICGDRVAGFKGNVIFWHEISHSMDQESPSLRDKSVSFGFGLEMSARPTTCIGIHNVNNSSDKYGDFENALKGSLPDMKKNRANKNYAYSVTTRATNSVQSAIKTTKNPVATTTTATGINFRDIKDSNKSSSSIRENASNKYGVSKVVKFDSNNVPLTSDNKKDNSFTCNIENTIIETLEPIPYADEDVIQVLPEDDTISHSTVENRNDRISMVPIPPLKQKRMTDDTGLAQAVNLVLINKQTSTESQKKFITNGSDCDNDDSDEDSPPKIEPRKKFLIKKAPIPPPRPSKNIEHQLQQKQATIKSVQPITAERFVTNDLLKLQEKSFDETSNKSKMANVIDLKSKEHPMVNDLSDNVEDALQLTANNVSAAPANQTNCSSQKKIPATKHFLEESFEGLELLTPNKTKTLTLKKKNSILAKRRKISLKTLEVSDIQGHLYRRTKDKHGVTYWAKLYFVLAETALYGFRTKESTKADCLIFLSGFTVSLATEVHSKQFAYKVYHPKKTFYFAAESQQAMYQWMEYIKRATIKGNIPTLDSNTESNLKDLFSETESSDEDIDFFEGDDRFGSATNSIGPIHNSKAKNLIKKTASAELQTSSGLVKHEKYHIGFGSLKKFTKQNLPFTSNKTDKEKEDKKKASSDIPVPTAQFRSYRKIPGNAGMQLGSNSMILLDYTITTSPPQPSPIPTSKSVFYSPVPSSSPLPPAVEENSAITSIKSPNLSPLSNSQQIPVAPSTLLSTSIDSMSSDTTITESNEYPKRTKSKTKKKTPYNYIHASNPNLVEFTFQTSKTLDYSLPKINPSSTLDTQHNLHGFITLKDLMLQKQKEDAQEMYNNRVNLGVEKHEKPLKRKPRHSNDDRSDHYHADTNRRDESEMNADASKLKPVLNKIQSRSLPKTPDYAQSFKPDDCDIIMARSKEGQKLRDFGYEFISGDDNNGNLSDHVKHQILLKNNSSTANNLLQASKKKVIPWIGSSATDNKKMEEEKFIVIGSFKKTKNKELTEFRSKNEKHMKYGTYNNEYIASGQKEMPESIPPLKPITSLSSLTMSQNKKPTNLNESLMFQLKKSQTTSAIEHRDAIQNTDRKISASIDRSASYFPKLPFTSTKSAKEKKLLGSPRLHRAIFGRKNPDNYAAVDHEIFSPVESQSMYLPKQIESSPVSGTVGPSPTSIPPFNSSNKHVSDENSQSTSANTVAFPDSNIEYPPIFEPETYSLCDSSTSLTLMRRKTFNRYK